MAKTQAEIDAAKQEFHNRHSKGTPILGEKNLKFAEGDEITARMIKAPYKAGKSFAVDFEMETETGKETVTYWVPTILGNLLKKVKEGDNLAIACVGKIATSNGDAYEFAVSKL